MNEIVVGIDSSPTARKAAVRAAELANQANVGLHIVTGVASNKHASVKAGPEEWLFDSFDLAESALSSLTASIGAKTKVTSAAVKGDPATALCEEAKRLNASMIVVGNKRVQGISRVLGSVASDVVKSAPCDVVIVRTVD